MSDPIGFLTGFGQVMSAHNLYAPGHPSRDRAIDAAHQALGALTEIDRYATFSFLDGEVVFGPRVLRELKGWEWAARLISIGMERVEFTAPVGRDALVEFVDTVHARLARIHDDGPTTGRRDSLSGAVTDGSIRWGSVSLGAESGEVGKPHVPLTIASVAYSLEDELEGVAWFQEQVRDHNVLPVAEATAVVRSLAVAMRQGGKLVLPLLDMAQFSQHMVTHACNVSVLSMGMAEYLGFAPREVSGLGVAALLHDIGNLSLPPELVNKATHFTEADRLAMQAHTLEGARLLLTRHRQMDLAAVVAYEHHLKMDGTGYPALRYSREPHFASRIVAVAEVYDSFCTSWPTVPAIAPEDALNRVEAQSGRAFDPDVIVAFGKLMRESSSQRVPASNPVVMVDGQLPAT